MKVFSVQDSGAEFFLPPFFAHNARQAERMFVGSLGDSFPFRQDFNLFELGEFDESTGQLTAITPLCVLRGSSIGEDLDPRVAA